jgi:aspartate aminotransferase
MAISNKVREIMATDAIRKWFEQGNALKLQYGNDKVFDLSLGNPITEPPKEFNEILKKVALNPIPGIHKYMVNAGYPETREAVAEQLAKDTGVPFKMGDIVMTCGAAGALNSVFKAVLNPQEEIIVFSPYFREFDNYIENHGGVVKVVPTDENFIPDLDKLDAAISAKTKAVLINSPNNPTGVVYTKDFLHKLGQLLQKKEAELKTQIYLLSDEAYRKLLYNGLKYSPIFPHYRNSIMITSHSKDLSLAGERIGFAAVNPESDDHAELTAAIIISSRNLGYINAPSLMQYLVRFLQNAEVPVAEYQKKRDFIFNALVEMGYSVTKPEGAFYIFPKIPTPSEDDFMNELLRWNVLVVPGGVFRAPGYFRIAYCVEDKVLEGSLNGFKKAAEKFGKH